MSQSPADETPEESYEESEILDQQQPEDTLVDRGVEDVLDEGYSAPEKWSAGESYGTTSDEQLEGETLDQRIEQEVPEADPYNDVPTEVLDDGEVGHERSGRLVDPDEGIGEDTEKDLVGDDVGIDAGAAGAEEAAVHTVDDEQE